MATISISQLDTATQASVDDLYEVAVVDENSQTGYASRKLTAAQIATLFAQGVQFSGLSTEAKTIIAAINEAAQNGGSEVEANPADEPTDTLETIGIDGTVYEVGGSEPVSKTATGNPIHIEDAADAPIVSGEVTFEPQQDLHGYNKPWAGGAGKNLYPLILERLKVENHDGTWSGNEYTFRGITFTVLTDNDGNVTGIKANGTSTNDYANLIVSNVTLQAGNYVISGATSGTTPTWRVAFNGSNISYNGDTPFTLTQETTGVCEVTIRTAGTVVNNQMFYPMIRLATETDPTFEPYENICPIEGYTDCEVEVTEKNLLAMTVASIKAANTTGTWSGNACTLNDVTFTILTDENENVLGIKANGKAVGNTLFYVGEFAVAGSFILNGCPSGGGGLTYRVNYPYDGTNYALDTGNGASFTSDGNNHLVSIAVFNNYTASDVVFLPMIRLATETDATFEPYQSKTYTIDLDGTRYGGKVYTVTGKMPISMGHIASYAGETIGEPWLSDRDEYVAGTTPTIGAEVVYTLASPTIVQLTPEQIRTLEGTNNISTNMTGMTVEYITQDYQPLVKLIERSAGHHYSTQERVVGTWFDKPLYERSYQITLASFVYNQWTYLGIYLSNVEILVDTKATRIPSEQVPNPVNFSVLGTVESDTNAVKVLNLRNADYGTNIDAYVTLQYTKTTD